MLPLEGSVENEILFMPFFGLKLFQQDKNPRYLWQTTPFRPIFSGLIIFFFIPSLPLRPFATLLPVYWYFLKHTMMFTPWAGANAINLTVYHLDEELLLIFYILPCKVLWLLDTTHGSSIILLYFRYHSLIAYTTLQCHLFTRFSPLPDSDSSRNNDWVLVNSESLVPGME